MKQGMHCGKEVALHSCLASRVITKFFSVTSFHNHCISHSSIADPILTSQTPTRARNIMVVIVGISTSDPNRRRSGAPTAPERKLTPAEERDTRRFLIGCAFGFLIARGHLMSLSARASGFGWGFGAYQAGRLMDWAEEKSKECLEDMREASRRAREGGE